MPQPPSSSSPRRFNFDSDPNRDVSSDSVSPDSSATEAPRRLISPRERFAPRDETSEEPVPAPEISAPESAVSPRLDDEMARRHLPPRERQKHERARIQREKREQLRRTSRVQPAHHGLHHGAHDASGDAVRTRAERNFALGARETAPAAPIWESRRKSRPRRRMPRFVRRILWLVALLFVGQLGFAAFTAPQFEIKSVEIEGSSATPPEDLRPIAGRLLGQNVLRANRMKIENAARRVPTVADAHVVRLLNWPPKVALQITERAPLLKVGAGLDWWVIDKNGVAYRRPAPEDEALYSVVVPEFSPALLQKLPPKIWARAKELDAALRRDNELASQTANLNSASAPQKMKADSSQTAPFWELRRVYFDKDGLASLRLARTAHREMLVRLGDDAWPEKLARARVALAYFERTGRRAAELDLVSLERPVWTPVALSTAAPVTLAMPNALAAPNAMATTVP